jgi:rhodanese-related sulfurtransferase
LLLIFSQIQRRRGGIESLNSKVTPQQKEKKMKALTRSKKMTRIFGVAVMGMLSVGMMGCSEGYIGPDGAPLLYYLPPENLREIVENPDPNIRLIDVRPAVGYQLAHIPTSENFPSGEIAGRLDELPPEDCYIVMCETGPRAQAVIENVLEPNGYRCFMNYGASIRWPYGFVSGPNPGTLADVVN